MASSGTPLAHLWPKPNIKTRYETDLEIVDPLLDFHFDVFKNRVVEVPANGFVVTELDVTNVPHLQLGLPIGAAHHVTAELIN